MRAVTDVVIDFQMPGHSIDGLHPQVGADRHGRHLRPAQHQDQVLVPVLRQWKVWDIEGLDAEGEKARLELDEFLAGLEAARLRASRSAATRAQPGRRAR